jgi:hypothetical protein
MDTTPLLAEGVGFEPTFALKAKAVFKTATISHSVTPPVHRSIRNGVNMSQTRMLVCTAAASRMADSPNGR